MTSKEPSGEGAPAAPAAPAAVIPFTRAWLLSRRSWTFAGGGVCAFAYVGALRTLWDEEGIDWGGGVPHHLHSVSGASIGSLFALALCLGYSVPQLEVLMDGILPPHEMADIHVSGLLTPTMPSLDDGSRIRGKVTDMIAQKMGGDFERAHACTLLQLRDVAAGGCDFMCNAVDMLTGSAVYMDAHSTPHMRVVDAVCASLSVPLVFAPVVVPRARVAGACVSPITTPPTATAVAVPPQPWAACNQAATAAATHAGGGGGGSHGGAPPPSSHHLAATRHPTARGLHRRLAYSIQCEERENTECVEGGITPAPALITTSAGAGAATVVDPCLPPIPPLPSTAGGAARRTRVIHDDDDTLDVAVCEASSRTSSGSSSSSSSSGGNGGGGGSWPSLASTLLGSRRLDPATHAVLIDGGLEDNYPQTHHDARFGGGFAFRLTSLHGTLNGAASFVTRLLDVSVFVCRVANWVALTPLRRASTLVIDTGNMHATGNENFTLTDAEREDLVYRGRDAMHHYLARARTVTDQICGGGGGGGGDVDMNLDEIINSAARASDERMDVHSKCRMSPYFVRSLLPP